MITKDGSHTLYRADINEHYHSIHGALQESLHVFIKEGFYYLKKDAINIFEVGFGTGLNACLTSIEAVKTKRETTYHSIELYPITNNISSTLNYNMLTDPELFQKIQDTTWNKLNILNEYFSIKKIQGNIHQYTPEQSFDLIYFDAFAPNKQPDIWEKSIFKKLFDILTPNGILTTYCAKGVVKRTLQEVGFKVDLIQGPPGKREMIRALK